MSEITSRIPIINWNEGFKKHWNDDNPAITHVFNALSFMFPQGERFFIKVAKEVNQLDDLKLSPDLKKNVKEFIVQEAMHTKHHQSYNDILKAQGYDNVAYQFIEWLESISHRYFTSVQKLAIVCAYEHYTATLGNFLLKNPDVLNKAPKKMSLIWEWHAAEEIEHKAVCFDLYKATGGSWLGRIGAFGMVSFDFFLIFNYLYVNMLWRDGCFRISNLPKTVWHSLCFFWGRKGVGWHIIWHGVRYINPFFHPWKQNNKPLLDSWLINNKASLSVHDK